MFVCGQDQSLRAGWGKMDFWTLAKLKNVFCILVVSAYLEYADHNKKGFSCGTHTPFGHTTKIMPNFWVIVSCFFLRISPLADFDFFLLNFSLSAFCQLILGDQDKNIIKTKQKIHLNLGLRRGNIISIIWSQLQGMQQEFFSK